MTRFMAVVAALVMVSVNAHAATDPVAKCSALKIKAMGQKTAAKAKCYSKAVQKGQAPPVSSSSNARDTHQPRQQIAHADVAAAQSTGSTRVAPQFTETTISAFRES